MIDVFAGLFLTAVDPFSSTEGIQGIKARGVWPDTASRDDGIRRVTFVPPL
jgi:hypothetical protein